MGISPGYADDSFNLLNIKRKSFSPSLPYSIIPRLANALTLSLKISHFSLSFPNPSLKFNELDSMTCK